MRLTLLVASIALLTACPTPPESNSNNGAQKAGPGNAGPPGAPGGENAGGPGGPPPGDANAGPGNQPPGEGGEGPPPGEGGEGPPPGAEGGDAPAGAVGEPPPGGEGGPGVVGGGGSEEREAKGDLDPFDEEKDRGINPDNNVFDAGGPTVTFTVNLSGFTGDVNLEFQHIEEGGAEGGPAIEVIHRSKVKGSGAHTVKAPAELAKPVYVLASSMSMEEGIGGGGPVKLKGSDVSVSITAGDAPDWLPKMEPPGNKGGAPPTPE